MKEALNQNMLHTMVEQNVGVSHLQQSPEAP